jgi:hypothetical protein
VTSIDPGDRRRTLTRLARGIRQRSQRAEEPVDAVLATALGPSEPHLSGTAVVELRIARLVLLVALAAGFGLVSRRRRGRAPAEGSSVDSERGADVHESGWEAG